MNHRIQVVDEDEAVRRLVTTHLTRAGHWVRAAATGDEAAAACAARGAPDLFVLDAVQPNVNYVRLLDELRSLHGCADVPALVLADHVGHDDIAHARARGYELLPKPLTVPTLLERTRQNLIPTQRSW